METTPIDTLNESNKILVPGMLIPSFRTSLALKRGIEENILFLTSGGIGDHVCAEPTLRFALKTFKSCKISLATHHPQFFQHLNFAHVYNLNIDSPNFKNYLVFETMNQTNPIAMDFFSPMVTHCIDYPSLSAIRCQLPVADKKIQIPTMEPEDELTQFLLERDDLVVVHAGKHWASRTFPSTWWNEVLQTLLQEGATPVLIGKALNENQGTIDVNTEGCIDLRDRMTITETLSFLQRSRVVLTNDSGPLHIAATGKAWIGFVATSKHPDLLLHWRDGGFGWHMQNHSLGGIWDIYDNCPNKDHVVQGQDIHEDILLSWLPDPKVYAMWAVDKLGTFQTANA